MQQFLDGISQFWFTEEVFHHILTFHNRLHILQREDHPSPQHSRTHRAHRLVNHRQEAVAPLIHRAQQLKAPHRELVHPHIFVLLYLMDASDVRDMCVQRLFQIVQHCTSSHNTILQVLHPVALQVLCAEMRQEFLPCRLIRVDPVIQLIGEELAAKVALKHGTLAPFKQHLLRRKVRQELLHIVRRALSTKELACRNVQQSHSTSRLAKMHRCQEIVLLHTQHVIRQSHTWCHQLRDASLHQFLRQFRIFQLVTNRHTLSRPDEFRQIRIQRMIRESSHRCATCRRASHTAAFRQRDAQNLSRHTRILIVCLIEVTTTKQQQSIRMLRLEIIKLFHHRGQCLALCHCFKFNYLQSYD